MIRVFAVLGLAVSATCGNRPSDPLVDVQRFDGGEDLADAGPPDCSPCEAWGLPQILAPLPPVLEELSGLAVSAAHRGVVYAHNDSGDSARFFALTETAALAATFNLTGATATDWEDIAVGPCPAGSCVYLGDIGDNDTNRAEYAIYRVTEPATLPAACGTATVAYDRFPFVYPDGSHNAETLLVDPSTGRIFVVTKVSGASGTVYELPTPPTPGQRATLRMVTTVSLPASDGLITGGDLHPCAPRLLLRTTEGLFQLSRPDGSDVTSLFTAPPVSVPVADEPQGEAVAYSPDGLRYFTSTEAKSSSDTPALSAVGCK